MNIHEQIRYEITYILEYLGIPINLFGYFLVFLIFILLYRKGKNIAKNEKLFKILFSKKYDNDFGDFTIGKFNQRHNFIVEIFFIFIATVITFIRLLLYIFDNY